MNDWMETHQFQEGVKVQRFCLVILVGVAGLLYESLRPINVDWQGYGINLATIFQKREHWRTIVLHVAIISFQ